MGRSQKIVGKIMFLKKTFLDYFKLILLYITVCLQSENLRLLEEKQGRAASLSPAAGEVCQRYRPEY